ncbi:hypothetical protein ZWY2020_026353 [Hordeum vulgare]|nr:hypothetical protein ZWY2020_026353 [Hordeum vulgare]
MGGGGGGLPWWLATTQCTPPPPSSASLAFIFLSPCPQRALLGGIDLLFLAASLILLLVIRLGSGRAGPEHDPLLPTPAAPSRSITARYAVALGASAVFAAASAVLLAIAAFLLPAETPWRYAESAFLAAHCAAHAVAAWTVLAASRKPAAARPPRHLRVFWIATALCAALFSASAAIRCAAGDPVLPDDVLAFTGLLLSLPLAYVAVTTTCTLPDEADERDQNPSAAAAATPYATASFLSRATFSWITPLVSKGHANGSLAAAGDVPPVSPAHRAEATYALLASSWPATARRWRSPVGVALCLSFWPQFLLTAALGLVMLAAMSVGPSLIDRFVEFIRRGGTPWEGLRLVLILLVGKAVQTLASHHYNFQGQILCMRIRGALLTALYRKSLRLSAGARRTHGAGGIVNYMQVDAWVVSGAMHELHDLWLMPLQISVALLLLYAYLGPAVLMTLAVIAVVTVLTAFANKLNMGYQIKFVEVRDSRVKALTEMLNHMRVIKLQAWEQTFGDKVREFRQAEVGWLKKMIFFECGSTVVYSSGPVAMAALVFGTYLAAKGELDAGKVFTATAFFRMLEGPMRSFPQTIAMSVQAFVSLGRLDKFLSDAEIDSASVERLGSSGSGDEVALKVSICGSTACVSQTTWIRNGTIQENILFGQPMHLEKYREIIHACCLEKDLEMMEFGDQTEIGERGINLSGGQKQRIQLARAVYQDCDIYLLDDIFSAVDAHTGSAIFKECLKGILKSKTVLLVTHQVDFLQNVDTIFVMKNSGIIQSGNYVDLLDSCSDFVALVAAHHSSMEASGVQGHNIQNTENCPATTTSQETPSVNSNSSNVNNDTNTVVPSKEAGSSKLIQEEEKESGRVSWHVYKLYVTQAWGWWGVLLILALSVLSEGSTMASNYWMSYETSGGTIFDISKFLRVYVLIVAVSIVFEFIAFIFQAFLGLKSAQAFFSKMLDNILRAPMSFFDTTPSGRILSRASEDQTKIDVYLLFYTGAGISMCISLASSIAVTCQVAWPSVIAVLPLLLVNIWYRNRYIATSRELTRLQGVTKAPVIDHLTESFSGSPIIRCFGKEDEFYQKNLDMIDSNLWFGFRLELIGTLVLSITAFLMISLPSNFIKKEFVGMSLSYGLSLNSLVYHAISISCMIENDMVSVERVNQYSSLPSEAAVSLRSSPNWLRRGDIDIKDLEVRYRPNTPLILKGITVSIRSGEKIGVVGRTGSGKSTLIQALFRLVEPAKGQMIVDGVDICTLGLHDLRSCFGVIPQEPALFEGTALERCQLRDTVAAKPEKLDALVADMGENWSVGQRQLLCLGRVILKRSRVLFMDEATASVDSQTDTVIQRIIREEFRECTVISIAHRVPTVMDNDRVLVLDAGLVKEFDAPSKMMGRPSVFGAMVQEYSSRSSQATD